MCFPSAIFGTGFACNNFREAGVKRFFYLLHIAEFAHETENLVPQGMQILGSVFVASPLFLFLLLWLILV